MESGTEGNSDGITSLRIISPFPASFPVPVLMESSKGRVNFFLSPYRGSDCSGHALTMYSPFFHDAISRSTDQTTDAFREYVSVLPDTPDISSVVFYRVTAFSGKTSYRIAEPGRRPARPDNRIFPSPDCRDTDTIDTVLLFPGSLSA